MEQSIEEVVWYQCNIVGGCRLSDLDRNVRSEEVFSISKKDAMRSRSVRAAKRDRWIITLSQEEAYKKIENNEGTPKEEILAPTVSMAKASRVSESEGKKITKQITSKPVGRQLKFLDQEKDEEEVTIPKKVSREEQIKMLKEELEVLEKGDDKVSGSLKRLSQ